MWAWTGFIWLKIGTRDGAAVNTSMKPCVLRNVGNSLTIWGTVNFWRRLFPHGVNFYQSQIPVLRKLWAWQASKSRLCWCECWWVGMCSFPCRCPRRWLVLLEWFQTVHSSKKLEIYCAVPANNSDVGSGKYCWMKSLYANKRDLQSGFSSGMRIVGDVGIMN